MVEDEEDEGDEGGVRVISEESESEVHLPCVLCKSTREV